MRLTVDTMFKLEYTYAKFLLVNILLSNILFLFNTVQLKGNLILAGNETMHPLEVTHV